MTTYSGCYPCPNQHSKHGNFLIWVILLVIVAGIALVVGNQMTATQHALNKHPDAEAIQKCINNNGPFQTWKSMYDKGQFYQPCQLPDSRWGIRIFKVVNGKQIDQTSFVPDDKWCWNDMMKWLARQATKFTGIIH